MTGTKFATIARLLAATVFVAACGSSSTASATLAGYASGHWACSETFQGGLGAGPFIKLNAIVSVTSASSGRVQLDVVVPAGATPSPSDKMSGAWTLRNDQLLLKWDDKSQGTATANPVSLATKQFKIRGDTPLQRGDWIEVNVNRQVRSVTFTSPLPGAVSGKITCTKA